MQYALDDHIIISRHAVEDNVVAGCLTAISGTQVLSGSA